MRRPQADILNDKLRLCIRKVLTYLKIPFFNSGDGIKCKCPIHGSSNPTSLTIYPNSGRWICWSGGCHDEHEWGLLSFVNAACKALNVDPGNISKIINETVGEPLEYIPAPKEIKKINISRDEIRSRLQIPSEYYLNRGFPAELLEEWMVGDCYSNGMANRAVVPVFDISGDFIGCSGRSHIDKSYVTKWKHSKNLPCSMTFFGIDRAKNKILETKAAILLEGFSDVIRLHSYGFTNSISPFGTKLTYHQAELLKSLGVENLIVAFDPDPQTKNHLTGEIEDGAGPKAAKKIYKKYCNKFNIILVDLPSDPDEMSNQEAYNYFNLDRLLGQNKMHQNF